MRRSVRTGLVAVAMSGVVLAGCGGGSGGGSTSTGTPADVVVHGDDGLKFDQKQYTATAGSISIQLVDDGTQPHTLVIDKVSSFKKLEVKDKGKTSTGTATLDPGTYTIYCDIPGHRGAGMEAKLVVN
jgi:plastocyanin